MSAWIQPEPANWWYVVDDALQEDVGTGDVTGVCLDPDELVDWYIEAQGDGVLSGVGIVDYLFTPMPTDPDRAELSILKPDGERFSRGDRIAEGRLSGRRVVLVERTALNFLMHLSGVASLTAQFVERVAGSKARIVDTRKTLPNLRALQKYAVRCGGGGNHRMGLFDAAMVKDNHIRALGSITDAVAAVRSYASHMTKIEVECENADQVAEAVRAKVDVILLDNMDPFTMREIVQEYQGKVLFEASGGITLDTVRGVSQTGVDFISVGQLTHSATASMFHLEIL